MDSRCIFLARHIRAKKGTKILWRIGEVNRRARGAVATGRRGGGWGTCLSEELLEHWRMMGQQTAIDAELDITRDKDYCTVVKPELFVALGEIRFIAERPVRRILLLFRNADVWIF